MDIFSKFQKWVSTIVDIMLGILIVLILIVMAEAIYNIFTYLFPFISMDKMSSIIEEIATLFIMLEIVLMLIRYVKDGHHIPVRYLILISMTAILRQLLLSHGDGIQTLFLAISILVLVLVLLILEKVKAFHSSEVKSEEIEETSNQKKNE